MKTRRSRLITVISVFILTLVIIISRLFYLYFEDSGFLQNKGKLKLITSRKILSIRGQILDKINNVIENDECSKAIIFSNCMDNCRNKLKSDNSKSQYSKNKSN